MKCPFLHEAQVRYCTASSFKKMIAASVRGDGSERCSSPRYTECAAAAPHLEEQVHDWVTSADFERLLRETVDATYPERERDLFMAHFKGLTDLWAADNKH